LRAVQNYVSISILSKCDRIWNNLYSFFLDHSSYSISFNPNLIYHESAAFFPTNPSGVFCQPFLIQYMAVSGSGGPVHAATLH